MADTALAVAKAKARCLPVEEQPGDDHEEEETQDTHGGQCPQARTAVGIGPILEELECCVERGTS